MTFGENKDGGGFSVSPSTVVNTLGALAIAGLASVALSDHSDIRVLEDWKAGQVQREEAARQTMTNVLADIQTLKDANIAQTTAATNIHNGEAADVNAIYNRLTEDERKLSDLDLILRPPRVINKDP